MTALRETVSWLDATLPLYDGTSLEEALADEISPQRTFAVLFAVFGAAALLLASVGLYGTMSFAVVQRQREFGVRRALGARSRHLSINVARLACMQLMFGLVIGIALASFTTPLLRDFTFGADPRDPIVFLVLVLALTCTTVTAAIPPTRRAAMADPMQVLRSE